MTMLQVHYQVRNSNMKTIDEFITTFEDTQKMHEWEEGFEEQNSGNFLHKISLEFLNDGEV